MISVDGVLSFPENDFVNREAHLLALQRIIQGTTQQQIVLIGGESGIGKTRLMTECLAQCQAQAITCVWIDFAEPLEQGYLSFILQLREQIGAIGFAALAETIQKLSTLGGWGTKNATASPMIAPTAQPDLVASPQIIATTGTIGADAQVAIGVGNTLIRAETVQHVALLINNDDWWMQNHVQAEITAAFQTALTACTAERRVVIFLDSWNQDSPTTEIRQWLLRTLFQWVARKLLPNLVLIVAGNEGATLLRLTQSLAHLELDELDADAIRTYWLDRRQLPLEEVDDIVKYSQGFPMLMVMLANRRALRVQSTHVMVS